MNDDRVKELLREAMPPMDTDPRQDLWKKMEAALQPVKISISRFDWALVAASAAWIAIFPETLIALLYHL